MENCIIYSDKAKVVVVFPTPDFANKLDFVIRNDIPKGVPYRVVNVQDLPPLDTQERWVWTEEGPLGVAEEVVATE